MKKALSTLYILIGLVFVTSCTEGVNECAFQPDLSDIEVDIQVEHLGDDLLNVSSKTDLRNFLREHPVITEFFLKRSDYPDDSVMMEVLLKRFQNPHMDTLLAEINRVFGDFKQLNNDIHSAFSHLKYYYPEAKIPRVKTVATGFDSDLFVSDSLIIIGLDYYLGDSARYRPLGLYKYMLDRYRPEYIVPSIMLLYGISPAYNKTNTSDKTILADMIGYGKSFYFAKRMMPCAPDSVLIWYSQEEIEGVTEHSDIVWAHFIEHQLLYETSHMVKKKYLDERPKTYEIGEKAPGRIGMWVGWDIVRQYMRKNENVTLQELMKMQDPRRIFNDSNYRPD